MARYAAYELPLATVDRLNEEDLLKFRDPKADQFPRVYVPEKLR